MASAQDNNIVIECSPYGDSETEIVNLKTPSFELIPMGNILDFGNSISFFIAIFFYWRNFNSFAYYNPYKELRG